MQNSSVSEDFNSDIEFIEKVMDYRSKLGIHWFLAIPSMLDVKQKPDFKITPKTQMLVITDMANNRFFPLVMFERPDMAALKKSFNDCLFNDPQDFKQMAFNTLSGIEGFCEGVMRCATVILLEHVKEFDPKDNFEEKWKSAIESAVNKITSEITKERPVLEEYIGISLKEWKFQIIPHKIEVQEKLETGADYSLRATRNSLKPR